MSYINKDTEIMHVIAREGGYVNDPIDPGGETNMGITHGTWAKYGDSTPLRDITIEQAIAVYDVQFWQKQRIANVASISPAIANNYFDASVNCGRCGATRILQATINHFLEKRGLMLIDTDGYIGQKTLDGLTRITITASDIEIENQFKLLLENHYNTLVEKNPKLDRFLNGWINRVRGVDHQ